LADAQAGESCGESAARELVVDALAATEVDRVQGGDVPGCDLDGDTDGDTGGGDSQDDEGDADATAEDREQAIALLVPQLEAILFVAREPVRTERLVATLNAPKSDVRAALDQLGQRFSGDSSGVHLVEIAGGWRLLSNPTFADTLAALHGTKTADRLSPAAMETLAIIAYKQPAGRAEIERIRGVGVGPVVRLLLELDLVRVTGRDDGLGRALLYGTTRSFLDRFGLGSLRDLPAGLEG